MSLLESLPIGHTFVRGEPAILPFNLVSRDASARHSVQVQVLVTDWQGLPVHNANPTAIFSVERNSSTPAPFTLNTSSIGYFQLTFNYTANGGTWSDLAFIRYAVVADMTMVGDASQSIFAMNTHMEREPSPHLKRNLGVLAKCGVKYIRAWWGWGMCEQVKGTFDFAEYERQYEAVTNGTGMLIMPILLRYYQSESFPWATWREAAWAGNTTCPDGNCSASSPCRNSKVVFASDCACVGTNCSSATTISRPSAGVWQIRWSSGRSVQGSCEGLRDLVRQWDDRRLILCNSSQVIIPPRCCVVGTSRRIRWVM